MSSEPALSVRREAWSGGDTRLARVVARPMVRFLAQEAASGVLLVLATAAALILANSPWADGFHQFWETEVEFAIGTWQPFTHHGHGLSLELWVNDGLMVLFFFVVGLEIKTELVVGDLADPRQAALPAIAAVGGMAVPALLYVVLNAAGDGVLGGWGVPMATDIAFAVGVLALLGNRVPQRLKLFVLTLAIVDDIGAIAVIALFYTEEMSIPWLVAAVVGLGVVSMMKRLRIWYIPVYVLVGVFVWYATFRSGIHATIAGVALGLIAPARPLLGPRMFESIEDVLAGENVTQGSVLDANWKMKESIAITNRLLSILTPWTSFLIIPIFALANAGVGLSGEAISTAFSSPVTWGIVAGLVIGKPLGVSLFTLGAVRLGISPLPAGVSTRHILGVGTVAGIGFTVALFISGLAFEEAEVVDSAIIGILLASLLATALGASILVTGARSPEPEPIEAH